MSTNDVGAVQRVLILRNAADPSYVRRQRVREFVGRIDALNKRRFYAGLDPVPYPCVARR